MQDSQGNATSDANKSRPVQVKDLADVVEVEWGFGMNVALRKDGTVWMWGGAYPGGVSEETLRSMIKPRQVEGAADMAQLSYGWTSTIGIGSTSYRSLPELVGQQPAAEQPQSPAEPPAPAAAEDGDPLAVHVTLNGKALEFEQPPVIIGEKTMVPMRSIFTVLGATIDWNDATRTVTATKGERTVELTIGAGIAYVNGKPVELEQPATIVNDFTVVPVRFIGDALGTSVDWVGATHTVVLTN